MGTDGLIEQLNQFLAQQQSLQNATYQQIDQGQRNYNTQVNASVNPVGLLYSSYPIRQQTQYAVSEYLPAIDKAGLSFAQSTIDTSSTVADFIEQNRRDMEAIQELNGSYN